jgi:dissimilatory sulfite reductase related protein
MSSAPASILDTVRFDGEGFMIDPKAWTPEIAEAIAQTLDIKLTDRHWIVINFARKEFEATGQSPTLRRITKTTPVDTKEIYQLFPGGPAKIAAKIAGLGKPTGCI